MRDIQMPLALDEIIIPDGRREVDTAVVKRLADSIENVGLRHPITVRRKGERYVLIAGLHRLEACRKLGREHVPATIVSMTNAEARMWEIAENLHRAELTKLERSNHIAEWVKLCEQTKGAQVGHPGGKQPHERGISKAASDLDINRAEVQRSVKIASIAPEVKAAAVAVGIDDNQSKLLAVASEAPEQQITKVHELAKAPVERRYVVPKKMPPAPKPELCTAQRHSGWSRHIQWRALEATNHARLVLNRLSPDIEVDDAAVKEVAEALSAWTALFKKLRP